MSRARARRRAPVVAAFAVSLASVGCGLLADVDWDRVAVRDGGAGSSGSSGALPDGAPIPGGGDGGAQGGCPDRQVECLSASGVACCPPNDDPGTPVAIAAGGQNTCAISSTGSMKCWGSNGSGQLGRGMTTPLLLSSNHPLAVFRIPAGAKQVTVGAAHVCATVDPLGNGTPLLACWGSNVVGQLGNGSIGQTALPLIVPLTQAADALGAGALTTCASIGGAGMCWGDNNALQGGNETDARILAPKAVTGLPALAQGASGTIVAGHSHSCAAATDAKLYCWGNNTQNRLGSNGPTMTGRAVVVTGSGAPGVTRGVTLGESHGCALQAGGGVACWGSNTFGELGDDSVVGQSNGVVVPTGMGSGATSLCAGFGHTCAIQDGTIKCWGENDQGQSGHAVASRIAAPVAGLSGLVPRQVACGMFHTCAIFDGGKIKCWGSNQNGERGDGTTDGPSSAPRDVSW